MNFYRLHTYGIWQGVLFTTAVLCLIYTCLALDVSVLVKRGFWCQASGAILAIIIPLLFSLISAAEPSPYKNREQRAFIFVLIWAYMTLQLLFLIGNLPFVIPIILAPGALIWFQKKNSKAPRRIQGGIWALIGLTLIASLLFAGYEVNTNKQNKALTEQALKNPIIKVLDVKENYIYTKEFGLERMQREIPLSHGQEIYRTETEDGHIFVVKK